MARALRDGDDPVRRAELADLLDPVGIAAEFLYSLRLEHRVELGLPSGVRPMNFRSAYAIQDRLVSRLLAETPGSRPIGYKIACSNERTQRLLRLSEPFFGRLLSPTSSSSPARLAATGYFTHGIEASFSFLIGKDVPPGSGPHSIESIAEYVNGVLPSLEVSETRFADWTKVGVYQLAADNAIHGAWVHGALCPDWERFAFDRHPVTLRVNGRTVREGTGKNVLGNPLFAVAWLANELDRQEKMLRAGQFVSTGLATELYIARPGERIEADFGAIGAVELSVIP